MPGELLHELPVKPTESTGAASQVLRYAVPQEERQRLATCYDHAMTARLAQTLGLAMCLIGALLLALELADELAFLPSQGNRSFTIGAIVGIFLAPGVALLICMLMLRAGRNVLLSILTTCTWTALGIAGLIGWQIYLFIQLRNWAVVIGPVASLAMLLAGTLMLARYAGRTITRGGTDSRTADDVVGWRKTLANWRVLQGGLWLPTRVAILSAACCATMGMPAAYWWFKSIWPSIPPSPKEETGGVYVNDVYEDFMALDRLLMCNYLATTAGITPAQQSDVDTVLREAVAMFRGAVPSPTTTARWSVGSATVSGFQSGGLFHQTIVVNGSKISTTAVTSVRLSGDLQINWKNPGAVSVIFQGRPGRIVGDFWVYDEFPPRITCAAVERLIAKVLQSIGGPITARQGQTLQTLLFQTQFVSVPDDVLRARAPLAPPLPARLWPDGTLEVTFMGARKWISPGGSIHYQSPEVDAAELRESLRLPVNPAAPGLVAIACLLGLGINLFLLSILRHARRTGRYPLEPLIRYAYLQLSQTALLLFALAWLALSFPFARFASAISAIGGSGFVCSSILYLSVIAFTGIWFPRSLLPARVASVVFAADPPATTLKGPKEIRALLARMNRDRTDRR